MQRNIGIFISHNCYLPLASAVPPKDLIINKTLLNPTLPQDSFNNYTYQLITLQTPEHSNIRTRAEKLAERLQTAVETHNLDKIHLISNSVNGLDARYMIAENPNLNRIIDTLVTISTPHKGSRLANLIENEKIPRQICERLAPVVGLSVDSMKEVNSGNIQNMNDFLDDLNDSRIFTMLGNQVYTEQSTLFKEITNRIIQDEDIEKIDTDGVFFVDELKHNPNQILGIFGADHYQMSCFSSDLQNKHAYQLALDFCAQRII